MYSIPREVMLACHSLYATDGGEPSSLFLEGRAIRITLTGSMREHGVRHIASIVRDIHALHSCYLLTFSS